MYSLHLSLSFFLVLSFVANKPHILVLSPKASYKICISFLYHLCTRHWTTTDTLIKTGCERLKASGAAEASRLSSVALTSAAAAAAIADVDGLSLNRLNS